MPPAMTAPAPPAMATDKPKVKTKAKQRYLRRKKERRKIHRRPGAAATPGFDETKEDEGGASSEEEANPEPEPKPEPVKKQKRPKKRQRVEPDHDDDVGMLEDAGTETHATIPEPETAPGFLPSFPLPALPHVPSKSTLALQGLDKALVSATLVDAASTLALPDSPDDDGGTGLGERTCKRLRDLGITELFAVQTALLPFLLPRDPLQRALYQPYSPPRDVCVSAPTGSGKTLAYVLPIIEILATRVVTRLRALIVLPTRDLVAQVRETFEAVGKGRGLKIGTATGQHSFAHEQSQLIADKSSVLLGGSSKVDVLICTPGRLMDHLNSTPNFSLQHLRFLVIDEADRLLAQSFQDWLVQVLAATHPLRPAHTDIPSPHSTTEDEAPLAPSKTAPMHDAVAPAFMHLLPYPDIPTFFTEHAEPSCQKLLFSATLTRDPGKIALLQLRDPCYFVVQDTQTRSQDGDAIMDVVMEKFTMPATLKEHMVVCSPSEKPLMFFHLIHTRRVTNALVFTKSSESTTRLVRLLEFFERARIGASPGQNAIVSHAYSSDLPTGERKTILEQFRAQKIQILLRRPVDMRKYVHRVGRTARAGREGDAWTLVEEQEARYFKDMLRDAELRVGEKDVSALTDLREVYTK
ncbi:P-loop containing nucleoside triphosphate hydrolase protein [Infundibulicybe gibba]|nr:P-loop containing nucleoside triphosphate hydrolase protein [Infundibulicybe gibba]